MALILNPKQIKWAAPTQYVDGTPFGTADFAGYEWGYRVGTTGDFTLTVAIPVAFNITSLDITQLGLPVNKDLDLVMRTVAKNGQVSDWSNAVAVRFDTRRPLAPSAVSAV